MLPKDYNPQVLPTIVCKLILSELVSKAKEEAKANGTKFHEGQSKASLAKSITSHLKNSRQAHRPEIISSMKVNEMGGVS